MKQDLIKRLELEIGKIPSGDTRNLLTDINIFLQSSIILETNRLGTIAFEIRKKMLGENPLTTIENIDKTTIELLYKIS